VGTTSLLPHWTNG